MTQSASSALQKGGDSAWMRHRFVEAARAVFGAPGGWAPEMAGSDLNLAAMRHLAATRNLAALRSKEAAAAAATAIGGAAPDEMLHQYVRELAGAPAGHRAIWLHLSRLDPTYRRDQLVQIACKVVEELIQHFTGRVFVRPNGDVVLISREMRDKIIRHTAELLRNVFESDARTQHNAADHLCSVYDLESDYPRFVSALLAAPQTAPAHPHAHPPMQPPTRAAARRAEPRTPSRARRRAAARGKPSRRFVVVLVIVAVVALVEGFFAYRSSQTAWVFDSPDAQKRHQVRNSWTGQYTFGK
jgi:hypothetical protein